MRLNPKLLRLFSLILALLLTVSPAFAQETEGFGWSIDYRHEDENHYLLSLPSAFSGSYLPGKGAQLKINIPEFPPITLVFSQKGIAIHDDRAGAWSALSLNGQPLSLLAQDAASVWQYAKPHLEKWLNSPEVAILVSRLDGRDALYLHSNEWNAAINRLLLPLRDAWNELFLYNRKGGFLESLHEGELYARLLRDLGRNLSWNRPFSVKDLLPRFQLFCRPLREGLELSLESEFLLLSLHVGPEEQRRYPISGFIRTDGGEEITLDGMLDSQACTLNFHASSAYASLLLCYDDSPFTASLTFYPVRSDGRHDLSEMSSLVFALATDEDEVHCMLTENSGYRTEALALRLSSIEDGFSAVLDRNGSELLNATLREEGRSYRLDYRYDSQTYRQSIDESFTFRLETPSLLEVPEEMPCLEINDFWQAWIQPLF